MSRTSASLFPTDSTPAPWANLFGRLVVCAAMVLLLFALWTPRLDYAATWTQKELRILPRMSVFVLSALIVLILRGARPTTKFLLSAGALCFGLCICWLSLAPLISAMNPNAIGAAQFKSGLLVAGPILNLIRFAASLFAAVFIGIALGRDINSAPNFVGLLLCASVGDIWLSTFKVPDLLAHGHLLTLLRLPWPPPMGQLALSPAFTDVLVFSATIEASARLGFHLPSVTAGAVAGYCAGTFLGLDPWPAWTFLSMIMFTSGVLVGCWPDMKCRFEETGKALLLSAVLMATLMGITSLHRSLNPPPQPRIEPARIQNAT